jgi:hypothetical protein
MADIKSNKPISHKLTAGTSVTLEIRTKVRIILEKTEDGDIDLKIEALPDEISN